MAQESYDTVDTPLPPALQPREPAPAPEAVYHGSILPVTVYKGGKLGLDPENAGITAAPLYMGRTTMDAVTGNAPMKSENIAGPAFESIPFAGSTKFGMAFNLPGAPAFTKFKPPPAPSDAELLSAGSQLMSKAMRRTAPQYPTGYGGESPLGPVADIVELGLPKGASRATSPEVYAVLDRMRSGGHVDPKTSPFFAKKLEEDPLIAKLWDQYIKESQKLGDPLAGSSVKSGNLAMLRENLPLNQPGAAVLAAAIDKHIASGPEKYGFAKLYGEARGNTGAAENSIAAAAKPAPGPIKRTILATGDALEKGGPLAAAIGAGLTGAAGAAAGFPFGLHGLTGYLGGLGGLSGANQTVGRALGGVVKSMAGKIPLEGAAGPNATAARMASPLYDQMTHTAKRAFVPEPTVRSDIARALAGQTMASHLAPYVNELDRTKAFLQAGSEFEPDYL